MDTGGGPGFNPFSGFSSGGFHFHQGEMPDELRNIFEDLFFSGGSGRGRGPQRGSDVHMTYEISFLDAVFGCKKDINFTLPSSRKQKSSPKTVSITIPAGINTGTAIRLKGQGTQGEKGANAGDLLLNIVVQPDNYFTRLGDDVHVELPITVSQAILGDSVDILTLDGMKTLKIPAGAQPQTQLVMKNLGIRQINSSIRGNQVVHLIVQIPRNVSSNQAELIKKFGIEENGDKEKHPIFCKFRQLIDKAIKRLTQFKETIKK